MVQLCGYMCGSPVGFGGQGGAYEMQAEIEAWIQVTLYLNFSGISSLQQRG